MKNLQATTTIKASELANNPNVNRPFSTGSIKSETEKAYYWQQNGRGSWIAKSQVLAVADVTDDSGNVLWTGLVLPKWLAKKI